MVTRHWFKIQDGPAYQAQAPWLAALKKAGFGIGDYRIGLIRMGREGRELEIIFANCVHQDRIDDVLTIRYLLCEP